jgi:serine/threonine protein kinase
MLSGQNPYEGETVIEIMRNLISKYPPEISELRPEISKELNELVMNMMNKKPEQRPSAVSVRDFLLKEIETLPGNEA